jgi:signal transduction histidine kinase
VDIGIQAQLTELLPLLQDPKGRKILDTAYQLTTLQKGVKTISVASERASKVVFALKNLARYDQSGEKTLVPVSEGIETVLTLYQNQLQHVKVVKHYDALPPLRCYPDALHQVWINLIHNALQAMNNKGTLTLEITQAADCAVIHIKDTGSGIPEEIQAKIFEPFFTTKSPGEGSGLGLDIVKKIVEKHEGEIKMTSQLHQGSTFSVWLPMG